MDWLLYVVIFVVLAVIVWAFVAVRHNKRENTTHTPKDTPVVKQDPVLGVAARTAGTAERKFHESHEKTPREERDRLQQLIDRERGRLTSVGPVARATEPAPRPVERVEVRETGPDPLLTILAVNALSGGGNRTEEHHHHRETIVERETDRELQADTVDMVPTSKSTYEPTSIAHESHHEAIDEPKEIVSEAGGRYETNSDGDLKTGGDFEDHSSSFETSGSSSFDVD